MSDPDSPRAPSPCPRCGGLPAPPRKPTARLPFLKPNPRHTCDLCGLEYDPGEAPWRPGETPRTLAPFGGSRR
jgi:hypothetical protein